MTIDTPDIPVMSKLEEAIHSDCDCEHGGLSVAFHLGPCPFTIVRTHARLAERPDIVEANQKIDEMWRDNDFLFSRISADLARHIGITYLNAALHREEK